MNVLITSGGTREPIDGVRVIANHSTGRTGAELADAFARAGAKVCLLRAESAVLPQDSGIEQLTFATVDDLDHLCADQLSSHHIDLMIHAAAVSDFVVQTIVIQGARYPAPFQGKLSSAQPFSVELQPGKKILPHLKSYSKNPQMKLVGFKLTNGANEQEIRQAVDKVLTSGADLVIHNDMQMLNFRATAWRAGTAPQKLNTMTDLAAHLVQYGQTQ